MDLIRIPAPSTGWICSSDEPQTSLWSTKAHAVQGPVIFALLIGVGTGGAFNNEWHRARQHDHFISQGHADLTDGFGDVAPASGAVNEGLKVIKEVLALSVSDVARHLGVSRQAVYGWKSGTNIKDANAARLSNLLDAANVLAHHNLSQLDLRRKLPGGRTLMENIAAGQSGEIAALALLSLLKQEAEERESLAALFQGRAGKSTSLVESPSIPNEA